LETCADTWGQIRGELCDVKAVEGNAQADHIHKCLSIPCSYSIAHPNGFPKGKVPSDFFFFRRILYSQHLFSTPQEASCSAFVRFVL